MQIFTFLNTLRFSVHLFTLFNYVALSAYPPPSKTKNQKKSFCMVCRIFLIFFLGLILLILKHDVVKFDTGLYSAPSSFMYHEKKNVQKSPWPLAAFSQVQGG